VSIRTRCDHPRRLRGPPATSVGQLDVVSLTENSRVILANLWRQRTQVAHDDGSHASARSWSGCRRWTTMSPRRATQLTTAREVHTCRGGSVDVGSGRGDSPVMLTSPSGDVQNRRRSSDSTAGRSARKPPSGRPCRPCPSRRRPPPPSRPRTLRAVRPPLKVTHCRRRQVSARGRGFGDPTARWGPCPPDSLVSVIAAPLVSPR
jgi:hypothetical protein